MAIYFWSTLSWKRNGNFRNIPFLHAKAWSEWNDRCNCDHLLYSTYPLIIITNINTFWNTAEHSIKQFIFTPSELFKPLGDEVLQKVVILTNEQKACRSLQKLHFSSFGGPSAAASASVYRPDLSVNTTRSACTVHVREWLSVLLQSFSQQIVQAGNHRSGIIIQACCDHGVVVDLKDYIDEEK